ncbi:fumarylacetoacetase [Nakamurella lactea]|uniref:fumarylacetoacetase n=1 Tax=Nakamurella lactea TaxID=459515 RepID=UPI00040A51E4|nr:fumarylacetoacetase [Nakamurella lactea]
MTAPRQLAEPSDPLQGFGIDHLPYGIFADSGPGSADGADVPRVGVRYGDRVLDTPAALPRWRELLLQPTLNALLAAGPDTWAAVRADVTEVLASTARTEPAGAQPDSPLLLPLSQVTLRMPFEVADYVDFYASEHHATNLGRLFRPDSAPLLPNWKHLPIGYHGRAGTVVPSGTPIRRPRGQSKAPDADAPSFGPSRRLDIEAEIGFVVGVGSEQGTSVPATDLAEHVFGVCLVNDWSARDLQPWEQPPLGPFLAKSFATSISAWITPLAALAAARVPAPARTVPVLEYLADGGDWGLDIAIEVDLNGTVVSRPPFAGMYWTAAQMMAHLTINGASLRTGDLFASGTVSGPTPDTVGSFIELSQGGRHPITLADGATRTFLQDGDTVTLTATAPSTGGGTLRLGEVTGTVLPSASR